MDILQFLTICPPEIKAFLFSDKVSQSIVSWVEKYRFNENERDQLVDLARDVLVGLTAVDNLPGRFKAICIRHPDSRAPLEAEFKEKLIDPNLSYLNKTEADVQKFKADNDLPEIVTFDVPKKPAAVPAKPAVMAQVVSHRPVPNTSDIRRPVKRIVPPATPVKPIASVPVPMKEEKPKPEQFQLRTVEDLINVPAIALAGEPDDEKKLVGRFKQEIQDIANYSGATRADITAGWKKSQIYHTYIEMGNDSIQQGKPIGDVTAFRKTAGKPYLTENQFHAVSEISRLLLR